MNVYPIIKLNKPLHLIKGDDEFIFTAERIEQKEVIINGLVVKKGLVCFLIKYGMIRPKLNCLDRGYKEYALTINNDGKAAYLESGSLSNDPHIDIVIKPAGIGIGSIILNHLFYFAKQEFPNAIIKGLHLSASDEESKENRVIRDKLYKNLGFDFKGVGGGEETKKLKLSEAKINLDNRGFTVKHIDVEVLKKQLVTTELEIEKFSNIEVCYPVIKNLYSKATANLGYKYSDRCLQGMSLLIVCTAYLFRDYLDEGSFFSRIAYIVVYISSIAFVLNGLAIAITAPGVYFFKKEYEVHCKGMDEFLSKTNLPIEKYLGKIHIIQILDEYTPLAKEQNTDTIKISCKYEDIFDLADKVIHQKKLLWSMARKFNENKVLINKVKEIYQGVFYTLARALGIEGILKKIKLGDNANS